MQNPYPPTAYANGVFSPEKLRCALVQAPGQVQQGSGEGGFGAEPGQVQQNPQKGSGEGLGGFEDQQGSGEGSGEGSGRLWCKARSGSEQGSEEGSGRVAEKVREKVPEKVLGGFGAEPGQVQQGSGEGSGEGLEGFGAEPVRFNRICGHLTHGTQLRCFQRLASQQVRTIWKNKTLRLLGIPPKLIKSPPTTKSMGLFWYQI